MPDEPAHGGSAIDTIHEGMEWLAIAVAIVGVVIILWGVLRGLLRLFVVEGRDLRGVDTTREREQLRHFLGYYLLLGLEFLVAADIIETLAKPTYERVVVLGGIVVIRIAISFSLNWELRHEGKKHE